MTPREKKKLFEEYLLLIDKTPKLVPTFALAFSSFVPVFLTISSSVWSRAMSPKLRPENNPDRHRRNTTMIAISQVGINALNINK